MLNINSESEEYQKQKVAMVKSFWNTPIDFNSQRLAKNPSPTILTEETPLSKIHFIFTMLNVNVVYVAKWGKIRGIITKLDFINKRRLAQIIKQKPPAFKLQTQDDLREYEKVLMQYAEYHKFFEAPGAEVELTQQL